MVACAGETALPRCTPARYEPTVSTQGEYPGPKDAQEKDGALEAGQREVSRTAV